MRILRVFILLIIEGALYWILFFLFKLFAKSWQWESKNGGRFG